MSRFNKRAEPRKLTDEPRTEQRLDDAASLTSFADQRLRGGPNIEPRFERDDATDAATAESR
jgi:hypothetical protein